MGRAPSPLRNGPGYLFVPEDRFELAHEPPMAADELQVSDETSNADVPRCATFAVHAPSDRSAEGPATLVRRPRQPLVVLAFKPAFTFHSPEHAEGYRAGRRGGSDRDNPYLRGGRRARAWSMGVSEGRTKQLVLVIAAGRPPEPQPPLQPPELPPNPEEPAPDPLPRLATPSQPVQRDLLVLKTDR